MDDLLTKVVDDASRIAERQNPGDTPQARHRRALVNARAPQAGLALMVTPWSKVLELDNDEVQLAAEQYLGLEVQAMAGLRRCTCSRDDRLTDLTQVANSYHALGCTRANPGKRAHWQLSRHMTAFINAHTTCDASLEPRVGVATGQRADVQIVAPTADAKKLYVDISTTCAALHFTTISHLRASPRLPRQPRAPFGFAPPLRTPSGTSQDRHVRRAG
jgi:hypothetical protein